MVTKSSGYVRESVTKFEPENSVSAGVTWGSLGDGMVPIFEEQAARLERNYTLEAWMAIDPMERAMIIAIRRIDIASKNLQADAEIREARRNAKKR